MLDQTTLDFNMLWNGEDTVDFFEFEEVLPKPNVCEYAQAFLDWADRTLVFDKDVDMEAIYKAKLMLLDRYFEWLSVVPKRHKYHLSERGHLCIFQVFVKGYQRIKTVELRILPPLFLPPAPPPPPRPEVLILGEEI